MLKVIMLVDSGSNHNFISVKVAKALNLRCLQKYQVGVTIANGEKVRSMGKCPQLVWSMQGIDFVADFLVLQVRGYDVVLGVQWLARLDAILWDFGALTMQIQNGEQWVILYGLP